MKKQFFSIILCAAVLVTTILVFSSCEDPDIADTGATGTTEEARTEPPASNDSTEAPESLSSESEVESQSETVETDEQTINIPEDGTVSFNEDLISDYRSTFDELAKKYGKVTGYFSPHGGTYFEFERGYGFYCCGILSDVAEWVDLDSAETETEEDKVDGTKSDSTETEAPEKEKKRYPILKKSRPCYTIIDISATDFFSEPFTTISIEAVKKIPGISYIKTKKGLSSPGEYIYISSFKYDDFDHRYTTLKIYHEDENEISQTSYVEIDTPRPYANDPETPTVDPSVTVDNSCPHGGATHFDDETMTLRYFESNTVENMVYEVYTFSGDLVRVFDGDEEVFEGKLKRGMRAQVYHDNDLYGEYVVD